MIGLKGKSNHNLIGAHPNPNRQTIAIFSLSNQIISAIVIEDWKIRFESKSDFQVWINIHTEPEEVQDSF